VPLRAGDGGVVGLLLLSLFIAAGFPLAYRGGAAGAPGECPALGISA
jgi:hypothetical protein